MIESELSGQFRNFATTLVEQLGGVVEWESGAERGLAVAPLEVSRCLHQTADTFAMTTQAGQPGLMLGLGGEFVDLANVALQRFVPATGSFELRDLPVKKSDYQSAVDAAFGWQNARSRVIDGYVGRVPYHTWWFHVTLQSDDAWESLIRATVNAESRLPIEIGDPLGSMQLARSAQPLVAPHATLDAAATIAECEAMKQVASFLSRAESRCERDRQRLKDYYAALLRDAATPNRRTKIAPSADEVASRQKAVRLELQRKLGELEERFAFAATVRPIAMLECGVPSVAIELEIQRKAAKRIYRVYWNGLLKRIEPLKCSECLQGSFNLWFTNDTVLPVCNACHARRQQVISQ